MSVSWLDEICDELALADEAPTLVLVDRAHDAQLPALLRALHQRFGEPALATTVAELRALPAHRIVLFAPALDEFETLNRARPLLRESRLRVLCWCDPRRSRLFAERAPDVYDWISRYIECPPAVHQLALWQLRRWAKREEPYIELRGEDWRAVLDAMNEPWIEVPADVLDDYQRTVDFVRAHPGARLASSAPGRAFDYFAGVRLVAAALTERCPLPVVLVGGRLRWFKQIDSEAPSLREINEARRAARSPLALSEFAALGRELMEREHPAGAQSPIPSEGDRLLEALWDQHDSDREGNHPIGMDPSFRLLELASFIGSGRSAEKLSIDQWRRAISSWELLQLSDIFASWTRENLAFVGANPEFVRGLLIGAEEQSLLELAPIEARARSDADSTEGATQALSLIERLQRALLSGQYREPYRWLEAERATLGSLTSDVDRWFASYARWIAGESRAHDELTEFRDLPPMLAWLAEQESLDRTGTPKHLRSRERFDVVEIDATEEWLPIVHMARYDEYVPAPHVEEPSTVGETRPTAGERRGRLIDLRARVLRGEVAMERRDFDLADKQLNAGVAAMDRWLGPTHPMTLVARAMQGRMYALLGSFERALSLLDNAASALEQQLGAMHADTLRVRLELARIRVDDPRVDRARVGLHDQLRARFGPDSPLLRAALSAFAAQ
jgi:hypothetical protein